MFHFFFPASCKVKMLLLRNTMVSFIPLYPDVRQLLNIGNREIIIFPVIDFQCAPYIFLRQWVVMLTRRSSSYTSYKSFLHLILRHVAFAGINYKAHHEIIPVASLNFSLAAATIHISISLLPPLMPHFFFASVAPRQPSGIPLWIYLLCLCPRQFRRAEQSGNVNTVDGIRILIQILQSDPVACLECSQHIPILAVRTANHAEALINGLVLYFFCSLTLPLYSHRRNVKSYFNALSSNLIFGKDL